MRKRTSPSEPLFRFLDIDAAEVGNHPALIDDMLHQRLDGVIVRGALPPEVVRRVRERLEREEVAFQRRVFTGFTDGESSPYTLGRPIVAATPDLVEYFETAADTRARLRELFAGEPDFEGHMEALFGALAGGLPVRVPSGPEGATYAPATFRFLPEGRDIGVHVGNSFLRLPQARHLAQAVDVGDQLSFFFTIAAPEDGGELVVYGLEWDDVARMLPAELGEDQRVYDAGGVLVPFVELCDKQAFKPGDGDLLLFDGGRFYHRVTHVRGSRSRCTLGGFAALARDRSALCYWS
jgi:hapalindole-type alkaloid chlorinase